LLNVNIPSKSNVAQGYPYHCVHLCLAGLTIRLFSWPSSLAGQAFVTLLNNPAFLNKYVQTNCKRLEDRYRVCTDFLKSYSIPYFPANSGFFIWIDLSAYLRRQDGKTPTERERALNDRLFNGGIHLATSEAFFGEVPGWFRLSFAVDQDFLRLGLKRYRNNSEYKFTKLEW